MNKFILAGRLGNKPQLNFTNNTKTPVTSLRIATKDKENNTTWHSVTVWRGQAELCCRYLDKGASIVVEGNVLYQNSNPDQPEDGYPVAVLNGTHVSFL